jgi:hypothetical protein
MYKVLQYGFFCSGQQKHELTICQTTRGTSRLLPAPLQLFALILHQARPFLISLPAKVKQNPHEYLVHGVRYTGPFSLLTPTKCLAYIFTSVSKNKYACIHITLGLAYYK